MVIRSVCREQNRANSVNPLLHQGFSSFPEYNPMSGSSPPSSPATSFSKRTRVFITIFSVTLTASCMLIVLARISHISARPFSTTATTSSTATAAAYIAPAATSHYEQHNNKQQQLSMRRVLAFGDSLTAGTSGNELFPYAPSLEQALQRTNTSVRHRGMPGWTTQMMLDHLDDDRTGLRQAIQRGQPDIVILMAGTNDLGHGASVETITDNLVQLHTICFDNGVARTIAIAIPPSGYQSRVPNAADTVRLINSNLLERASETDSRITYVPFPFAFEQGGENWYADTLHFSETGYRVLGQSLAPVVDKILQELDNEATKRNS